MINESPAPKDPCRVLVCCLLLSGFLAGCAGMQEERAAPPEVPAVSKEGSRGGVPAYDEGDHPLPGGIRFVPAPVPRLGLPPGVGTLGRDPGERETPPREAEPQSPEESFKTGYIEALLRDIPLRGVLGGDFVHPWPPEKPAAWVQNWRSAEPQPNSWGLPSLILGLRGIGGDRVFTVTGPILDAYGRGEGLKGANGAAGYGAPRGNPFPLGRGFAQRFDLGLFVLEPPEAAVFIPGKAPSAVLPCPPQTGFFPGGSPAEQERIREAFRSAWRITVDSQYRPLTASSDTENPSALEDLPDTEASETSSDPLKPAAQEGPAGVQERIPPLRPDGELIYYPFGPVLWAGAEGEDLPLGGIYVQLFEEASLVFILADSPALPPHVRVLRFPFTEALLASQGSRLPGAETLVPAKFPDVPEAGMAWLGALLKGLALYGIPLTDEVPRYEAGTYRRAQRFSRGWMILEE